MMKNRYLLLVLLGTASLWVYGQGVPLESHLMGKTKASTHNLDLISVGDASITDATITNATVTAFHSVQGFPFELVGGASSQVLAVWEDLAVRPTDPNALVTWPPEAPAFAHIVADVTRISATNPASQITLLEGDNMAFSVDEANSRITLTSLADGSTNPAYSSIAVEGQKADATSPASQFTLIAGSNIGLTLDALAGSVEILAQARGAGNGVPTVIIAATDSLNAASADLICDGTGDQAEMNEGVNRIRSVGGVVYLMEGSYLTSAPIQLDAPGVELRGSGWHSVITRGYNEAGASSGMIQMGSTALGIKGQRIADLTLVGKADWYANANNNGIFLANPSQSRVDHVRVQDCAGAGLWIDGNLAMTGTMITNDYFTENDGDGLYINKTGGVTISSCIFNENGGDGLEMVTGGQRGCAITGCISYNNTGMGYKAVTAATTLTGCVASSNAGDFYLETESLANGCYSYSSDGDGFTIGGSNVTLSGFYVYTPNGDGVVVEADSDDVHILGGYVRAAVDDAVVVNTGCDRVKVSGCWLNADGKGALIQGAWTMFDQNYVYSCEENAVYANGSHTIIQNNMFHDNGGATSNACVMVVNDDYVLIQKNRFSDLAGSSAAIYIDDDTGNETLYAYLTLNFINGTWASPAVDSSGNGTAGHSDFMQSTGVADVYILAGSAGAKIGLGTRVNINNILTVSSSASTNPIATSWDTWSDPGLKENILPLTDEGRKLLGAEFSQLKNTAIQFDWKFPQPEPRLADYADRKDDGGKVLATAGEQYQHDLASYQRAKAEWEATPGKTNQRGWNISDPNFPDRLKSYDVNGKAVGINTSQMIFELYNAVQTGIDDLEALKKEVEELKAR